MLLKQWLNYTCLVPDFLLVHINAYSLRQHVSPLLPDVLCKWHNHVSYHHHYCHRCHFYFYYCKAAIAYDTRGVLDLGDVTSTSAGDQDADNQITVEYDILLVSQAGFPFNKVIWASVGMQYSDGNFIWIASISYTLKGVNVRIIFQHLQLF